MNFKQGLLALTVATTLVGCGSTSSDSADNTAKNTNTGAGIENPIADANLGLFRTNSSKSDVWVKHSNSKGGRGDVGSSGDTAFKDGTPKEGSVRIRFKKNETNHDFTAKPGLSQVVAVPTNKDLTYSLYYCDKKKEMSLTTLHYGVKDASGKVLAEARAHVKDLAAAPQAELRKCFKQVSVNFNSANNSNVQIFALMEVDTKNNTEAQIYASPQFKDNELEVRLDSFSIN